MREFARCDDYAAGAVSEIGQRRIDYLATLFRAADFDEVELSLRAQAMSFDQVGECSTSLSIDPALRDELTAAFQAADLPAPGRECIGRQSRQMIVVNSADCARVIYSYPYASVWNTQSKRSQSRFQAFRNKNIRNPMGGWGRCSRSRTWREIVLRSDRCIAPATIVLGHADDPVFEFLVDARPTQRLALRGEMLGEKPLNLRFGQGLGLGIPLKPRPMCMRRSVGSRSKLW
jgi:hypothetical protein